MTDINIERVYSDPDGDDGYRVLVDRLWPRGESKEKFHYHLWAKDIAPSDELREWFHQDPDGRWNQFREKYLSELESNPQAQQLKSSLAKYPKVTLLYSSRDTLHNNAIVVADFLRK